MRFTLTLVLTVTLVAFGCGDDNDATGGAGGAAGVGGNGGAAFGDLEVLAAVPSRTATDMTDRVEYRITCEDVVDINGALPLEADPSGPGRVVETAVLDLPPVTCRVTLTVRDDDEAEVCSGSAEVDVVAGEVATLSIPVTCFGDLHVLVSVESTPVTDTANAMEYRIVCGSELDVSGVIELEDDPSGPGKVADNTFLELPEGPCDVALTVRDDDDAAACTGSAQVSVVAGETAVVNILLNCPDAPG